jgi:rSAM/selenodomain-associated transferase 1
VSRLYFAAKAPLAGQVKTRLGAAIGMKAAAGLYAAFLQDLAGRFASGAPKASWYVTPGSRQRLERIVGGAASVRVQRGCGWAARQANLFRDCQAAGEGAVVLAATDSPQLEQARVRAAFDALESNDLVLGPTTDGGYYLVGMHRFHEVFSGVAMSTESALEELMERARSLRLSTALLDPEFDVDTVADLEALEAAAERRPDLAFTAAALAAVRSGLAA